MDWAGLRGTGIDHWETCTEGLHIHLLREMNTKLPCLQVKQQLYNAEDYILSQTQVPALFLHLLWQNHHRTQPCHTSKTPLIVPQLTWSTPSFANNAHWHSAQDKQYNLYKKRLMDVNQTPEIAIHRNLFQITSIYQDALHKVGELLFWRRKTTEQMETAEI